MIDEGSFIERDAELRSADPLRYPGYEVALSESSERSGATESVVAGSARSSGHDIEIASFNFKFLGGSMGEVAGEKLARAMERAAQSSAPFVLTTSTGGARMQEGMRSLVQMPKVVAARLSLGDAGVPFIALLGHPTTGGVLASLGGLADVTLAVSGATIGFAGPRVVERFTGSPLETGSHTAESALEHGLVDAIVAENDARGELGRIMDVLASDEPAPAAAPVASDGAGLLNGWDAVQAARAPDRLAGADLVIALCDQMIELRGDRAGHDDRAVICALGRVEGRKTLVMAIDRSQPPGAGAFRKAKRCVEVAGRIGVPVVTLVDTPGADPSEPSEAEGVAWAIAGLFETMLTAPVPVLSIVTGEGGSGGALAFAAGDALVAFRDAIFSVIGPESAAEILWRDPARAPEAARALKLTAPDLLELSIADAVVGEPLNPESLRRTVAYHLDRLAAAGLRRDQLVTERRRRWRNRD